MRYDEMGDQIRENSGRSRNRMAWVVVLTEVNRRVNGWVMRRLERKIPRYQQRGMYTLLMHNPAVFQHR